MDSIKKYILATAMLGMFASFDFVRAASNNEEDAKEAFDASRFPEIAARMSAEQIEEQELAEALRISMEQAMPEAMNTSDDSNGSQEESEEDLDAALALSLQQTEDAEGEGKEDADSESNKRKRESDSELTNVPPLVLAAKMGHHEIVDLLLRARANPNDRDENGKTALIWTAIKGGNSAIMGSLISAKADVNAKDVFGRSALDYVTANRKHDEANATRIALQQQGVNTLPLNQAIQAGIARRVDQNIAGIVAERDAIRASIQAQEEAELQAALAASLGTE